MWLSQHIENNHVSTYGPHRISAIQMQEYMERARFYFDQLLWKHNAIKTDPDEFPRNHTIPILFKLYVAMLGAHVARPR